MNIVNSEAVGIGNKFENDHNLIEITAKNQKKIKKKQNDIYKLIKPNQFSIWNTSHRSNSRSGWRCAFEKKRLCCSVLKCVLFEKNLKKDKSVNFISPFSLLMQWASERELITQWKKIGKRKKAMHFCACPSEWVSVCVTRPRDLKNEINRQNNEIYWPFPFIGLYTHHTLFAFLFVFKFRHKLFENTPKTSGQ